MKEIILTIVNGLVRIVELCFEYWLIVLIFLGLYLFAGGK